MTETLPNFTTIIITTTFLLLLGVIAYIIKVKSGSLKKIIKKQDQLEVLNQMQLRNGYFAYIFKTGDQNFFFVGHKSGRSSLLQITANNAEDKNSESLTKSTEIIEKRSKSNNNLFKSSSDKKPLQHVNISDLLTAHKKGGSDA